jgi:hypothetical protein
MRLTQLLACWRLSSDPSPNDWFSYVTASEGRNPSIDLPEVISLPPTVAWEAHKSLLASLLTTADWYAVATAYESVQILRAISKSDSLFVSEGRIPAHEVVTKFLMELITAIQAGAEAASRLAGNPDPNPQHPAYRHLSENVAKVTNAAANPVHTEGDPSSRD